MAHNVTITIGEDDEFKTLKAKEEAGTTMIQANSQLVTIGWYDPQDAFWYYEDLSELVSYYLMHKRKEGDDIGKGDQPE